jgi:hypothetical protein
MLSWSSARVIGVSSSMSVVSSSVVWTSRPPRLTDPNANTPRSVRVKPGLILPSPGTSRSPLSHRVTESGTVSSASRLTSG